DVRQNDDRPGPARVAARRREEAGRVVVVMHRQTELLEVVLARGAGGGLADFLDGWEEQADQDGDDGDDDQQLDQREGARPAGRKVHRRLRGWTAGVRVILTNRPVAAGVNATGTGFRPRRAGGILRASQRRGPAVGLVKADNETLARFKV